MHKNSLYLQRKRNESDPSKFLCFFLVYFTFGCTGSDMVLKLFIAARRLSLIVGHELLIAEHGLSSCGPWA